MTDQQDISDPTAPWTPRYIVQKAPGVGGPPIPDDEPCLVIRGQDELAVAMIDAYCGKYAERNLLSRTDPVLRDLEAHRKALIAWRDAHFDRVKRADR